MRRYLPYAIVGVVFALAVIGGFLFFRLRQQPTVRSSAAVGKPEAEPAHVRGIAAAPVALEEFGDFECMPCFLLWPALSNLEKDFGKNLSVIFRERPLPQHHHALDAARAAEAAGLQGKFWEMHDVLYLQRAAWVRSDDPRSVFHEFARALGLDVDRFRKDMDGKEVAKRLAADQERSLSLGIDRTPAIFINGRRAELQGDVEKGLRDDIQTSLDAKSR